MKDTDFTIDMQNLLVEGRRLLILAHSRIWGDQGPHKGCNYCAWLSEVDRVLAARILGVLK